MAIQALRVDLKSFGMCIEKETGDGFGIAFASERESSMVCFWYGHLLSHLNKSCVMDSRTVLLPCIGIAF